MKKTVLITGAAKRMGREVALYLAKQGYNIVFTYNNSLKEANQLQKKVVSLGGKCECFQCDFVKEESCSNLLRDIKKRVGKVELLVNNASQFNRSTLKDISFKELQETFSINLFSVMILTRDFQRVFKKGHIINILDSKISKNDKNYLAYTLSKKSLADFTKVAALDLAPTIRVNGIAPGYILKPKTKDIGNTSKIISNIPLKRKGNIESILASIDFLELNEYVTGEILYVDGGSKLK